MPKTKTAAISREQAIHKRESAKAKAREVIKKMGGVPELKPKEAPTEGVQKSELPPSVKRLLDDADAVNWLTVNSQYMRISRLADYLGVPDLAVEIAAAELGLGVLDGTHLEPRASEIIQYLGHIPNGAKIEQTLTGGTKFLLPGNDPGITEVMVHFGFCDESDEDEQ